jgi:hypothetical protein
MGAREHDRALLRSSLAGDLDPGRAVEDEPDARADDGMIIDEQDPDIHLGKR